MFQPFQNAIALRRRPVRQTRPKSPNVRRRIFLKRLMPLLMMMCWRCKCR